LIASRDSKEQTPDYINMDTLNSAKKSAKHFQLMPEYFMIYSVISCVRIYMEFDRRSSGGSSTIGYRETDKNQIIQSNMKFLSPDFSAELYKVMAKINNQHIPIYNLPKNELYTLFYGRIYTCSVNPDGTKRLSEEEMKIYSEIMADCYYQKCSDVDVFIYQKEKDIPENEKTSFLARAENFRTIQRKFEQIMGRRDKL
jgi:hypothetical protein